MLVFRKIFAYVLNGWPQFTYSLFQIMFCWFDYISFCLFTVNLLSLTLLTSSNGWKPLSIFKKSVLKGLLRGYSKITSIRKREGSSREVWQKMTGGKAVAERWCHFLKIFLCPRISLIGSDNITARNKNIQNPKCDQCLWDSYTTTFKELLIHYFLNMAC